jgi:hypothetical protein
LDMWLGLSRTGSVAETTAFQGLRRLHPLNMSKSYAHSTLDKRRPSSRLSR